MAQTHILPPGASLTEGQFIADVGGNWFAGVTHGQFGVWTGTPEAPTGTAITFCYCVRLEMTPTRLVAWAHGWAEPVWSTPAGAAPCFAVIQTDGNLCVYEGYGRAQLGPFVFGSIQAGALRSDFKPFPQYSTTVVNVDIRVGNSLWCIVRPDGSESNYTSDSNMQIWGETGGSCCLRAKKWDWSASHDSGDNFTIGEENVRYQLFHDDDPFTSTYFAWDRQS